MSSEERPSRRAILGPATLLFGILVVLAYSGFFDGSNITTAYGAGTAAMILVWWLLIPVFWPRLKALKRFLKR